MCPRLTIVVAQDKTLVSRKNCEKHERPTLLIVVSTRAVTHDVYGILGLYLFFPLGDNGLVMGINAVEPANLGDFLVKEMWVAYEECCWHFRSFQDQEVGRQDIPTAHLWSVRG